MIKVCSELLYLFLAEKLLFVFSCCNTVSDFDLLFLNEAIAMIKLRKILLRKQLFDVRLAWELQELLNPSRFFRFTKRDLS